MFVVVMQSMVFKDDIDWYDQMAQIVERNGFRFVDALTYDTNKASHFNRSKDGSVTKREYESMLIFQH